MRVNRFQLSIGNLIVGRRSWVFEITPSSESRVVRIRFEFLSEGGFLVVKSGSLFGIRFEFHPEGDFLLVRSGSLLGT